MVFPNLRRNEIEIDEQVYVLLDAGGRTWETEQVAAQPGDAITKPYALTHHGGFGASQSRFRDDGVQSDSLHHDYAENVDTLNRQMILPSPATSFVDLSTKANRAPAFRIGGFSNSRIGGGSVGEPTGAIGGGVPVNVPQDIIPYGDYLYVLCGARTVVVNPDLDTPVPVEGRNHGSSARARTGDVFNTRLCIALGDTVDAEIATSPFTESSKTTWTTATDVKMSVYQRGSAGRLFSAQANKVFNVLPGQNPATAANYLPTNGEVITDPSDPVRALEEFTSALVAGTAKTARTFDADRGFQSVALIHESRLSASQYTGRAMIADGPSLYHSTGRGIFLISLNQRPIPVGPEELENNESPYVGGEPGVPALVGKWIVWPFYFPDTGDSVIFWVRPRREDEPGTGPLMWHDRIYLEGRECRTVRFWGGTATRKPRLFFGAGTESNALQLGWIDLGKSDPDVFSSDASPATSSTLFYPMDDFGHPGVTLELERIEMPKVEGADDDNYLSWAVLPEGQTEYLDLVTTQDGFNPNRVTETGYQRVFAQNDQDPDYPVAGTGLKFRLSFTQSADASEFVKIRGNPMAYIAARPQFVQQVTTILDVESQQVEDAESIADRLRSLMGEKVQLQHGPGNRERWARIAGSRVIEVETRDATSRRLGVQVQWREIAA